MAMVVLVVLLAPVSTVAHQRIVHIDRIADFAVVPCGVGGDGVQRARLLVARLAIRAGRAVAVDAVVDRVRLRAPVAAQRVEALVVAAALEWNGAFG